MRETHLLTLAQLLSCLNGTTRRGWYRFSWPNFCQRERPQEAQAQNEESAGSYRELLRGVFHRPLHFQTLIPKAKEGR